MTRRRPPGARRLAWAAAAVLVLALLLAFLSLRSRGGAGAKKTTDTEVEGVDLTYYDFDKSNRKRLEIRCRESQKEGDDRLRMKGVRVTIFDTERQKDDIRVTAETGTFSNNFHDFYIQGRARIFSSSFSLSSPNFNLKDRDILTSKEKVGFQLEHAQGEAAGGLRYYINHKVLKLFGCEGVWTREGVPYEFRCRTLWVFKKKNQMILEGDAELAGQRSSLRSNWISMQFSADFVSLQTTHAVGRSFFRHQANPGLETEQEREITANVITLQNDAQGRPQRIHAQGHGRVVLTDAANQGRLESDEIEIQLNAETQSLETVRVLQPGSLSNRGRENVGVDADSLQASFDRQGRLARVRAQGKCRFTTDDFSGSAASLDHDAPNSLIQIAGAGSSITSRKNTFLSSSFALNTRLQRLRSDQGIQATLIPGRKSVLLQAKPVFVTSSSLETSERGNVALFKGKVKLFQDEVLLQAEELLFDSPGGKMSCRGGADLTFTAEGEPVLLHGAAIDVDPQGAKMAVDGEARLRQGENGISARKIELSFNRGEKLETITAREDASFSRKDLSGKAQLLLWQYAKKTMWFKKSAEITRRGAGTTRGQELRFDMDSNRITVTGSGDRSQTTIDEERP